MRKLSVILLSVMMILSLAACKGKTTRTISNTPASSKSEISGASEIVSENATDKSENQTSESSEKPESIPASAEEPASTNPPDDLVNGMRPAFVEAMDSYEAFYDDYCEFMKKYSANPTDITLLAEYAKMTSKLLDIESKFKAWDDSDMNNAELSYYIEVQGRITQKLLEVAQ